MKTTQSSSPLPRLRPELQEAKRHIDFGEYHDCAGERSCKRPKSERRTAGARLQKAAWKD